MAGEGAAQATSASRPLARIWRLIAVSLDGRTELGGPRVDPGGGSGRLLVLGGMVARRGHAHRRQAVGQLARFEVVILLPAGVIEQHRGELPQLVALLAPDTRLTERLGGGARGRLADRVVQQRLELRLETLARQA